MRTIIDLTGALANLKRVKVDLMEIMADPKKTTTDPMRTATVPMRTANPVKESETDLIKLQMI